MRRRFAVGGDDRGDQSPVIGVAAGPDANFPLPFRVAKILVAPDRPRRHAILQINDNTGPQGQAGPVPFGIAVARRHVRVQPGRFDRLQQPGVLERLQTRETRRQHHIGRGIAAFPLEPLQNAFLGKNDIYMNAGILGETVEKRPHQEFLTIRIDIHFANRPGRGGPPEGGEDRDEAQRRPQ